MPTEFLWAEWGAPDKVCQNGVQQRTTMCGALRRRLPNLGKDDGAPPVYWPKCLTNKLNEAEVHTLKLDRGSLGKALCMIFTILLTLCNSEQKNGLLIKLFCFSSYFDETW